VSSLNDAEAMSRVRDGHVEMLALLFERHHVKLFNFFLRLTSDRTLSEDLVQELFLRMLKYRHTFRSDGSFVAWTYRIARHVHFSHLRHKKPELPLEDLLDREPAPAETPAQRMERRQDEDILRRALERLPLRKREILILSREHDLKYKEIASVFECSIGAVKVQAHRAVKDLRKIFLELQGGAA
jgi:RNA polymerase sigma-70 factor (ECF subfamily)